jgi:hypothetical protein
MAYINGYMEQCKNWSDRFAERLDGYAAHAAAPGRQAPAHPQPPSHPRIAAHTIHAVWQTMLPVCNWTRPWTQVLSLGEPSGQTSPAHLRVPGHGCAGATAVGPLPDGSCVPGRTVRHRLRVAHAPCRSVVRTHVVGQSSPGGVCDRRDGRPSTRGQHVGTRPQRSSLARAVAGGGAPGARR